MKRIEVSCFVLRKSLLAICIVTLVLSGLAKGQDAREVSSGKKWSVGLELGHHSGYAMNKWYQSDGVYCSFTPLEFVRVNQINRIMLTVSAGAGVHATNDMDAFDLVGYIPYFSLSISTDIRIIKCLEFGTGLSTWLHKSPDVNGVKQCQDVRRGFIDDKLYINLRLGYITEEFVLRLIGMMTFGERKYCTYSTNGALLSRERKIPYGIVITLGKRI